MINGPVLNEYWIWSLVLSEMNIGYDHYSCQERILDMIIGTDRIWFGYDYWFRQEWISDMIVGPVRIGYWIWLLVLSGMDIGFDHWSYGKWIWLLVLSGMDIGYDHCSCQDRILVSNMSERVATEVIKKGGTFCFM